jgi:hypothetical protein
MHSAATGETIFVDKSDTGERCVVDLEKYPQRRIEAIGGTCIINKMGTRVCLLD